MSKITKSAKGEECQIRLADVCLGTRDTVVWAHANGSAAGKGIGMKSHDLLGAYACQACHDCYDRRVAFDRNGELVEKTEAELAFWQGHARSLVILIEKGLVKS